MHVAISTFKTRYKNRLKTHQQHTPIKATTTPIEAIQKASGAFSVPASSLKQRRRVAALTMIHKAQISPMSHLSDLRAAWRKNQSSTRRVLHNTSLLKVLWSL